MSVDTIGSRPSGRNGGCVLKRFANVFGDPRSRESSDTSQSRSTTPTSGQPAATPSDLTRMERVAANAFVACGLRVKEVGGDPAEALPYEMVAGSFRFSQRVLELKRRDPRYRETLGQVTPDVLIFEATAYFQAMLFSFMASAPEEKEDYLLAAFAHARAEVSAMLGAMCSYPIELFAERLRGYPATIPGGVERFFQAVAAARGRTDPAPTADVVSVIIRDPPIPTGAFYKDLAKPLLDPVFKAMVTAANAI